jgi:ubiquinone biosynthesis accessory factor UbiK
MAMAEPGLFEEFDRRMRDILARSPAQDMERNLRALMTSVASRLDLVTREEFDVQRELLVRTRAKLEELEARLAELEQSATGNPGAKGGERKAEG